MLRRIRVRLASCVLLDTLNILRGRAAAVIREHDASDGAAGFGGSLGERSANMDDSHFSLIFGRATEVGDRIDRVQHQRRCLLKRLLVGRFARQRRFDRPGAYRHHRSGAERDARLRNGAVSFSATRAATETVA